jgi:dihydrofolate reductase
VIVSIIVAMDERRGIGLRNQLPWRLSSDLRRFRDLTMGHHLVVGRKTFESIGKPLPGRQMIVVTRNPSYRADPSLVVASVEEALELAKQRGETEVFICGGAEIYAQTLERADRMYVTLVRAQVSADTFFPEWDDGSWVEEESLDHGADQSNQYGFTFKVYSRSRA